MQALDCTTQALVIVDAQKPGLPVIYVNSAFESLTGLNAGAVISGRLEELVTDGHLPDCSGQPLPDHSEPLEQTWRLEGGGGICLNVRQVPLFDRPGKPTFWLLIAAVPAGETLPDGEAALRDALHDAQRRLRTLERTDSATGVPNEDAFGDILQRDWAIARREQRRLGMVVFQVDYLDEYRNSLGRHATNSVLRKVAHAINGSLRRAGDFGARVGDDCFAVLLGSASEEQARQFGERAASKVGNLAIPHPRSPAARNITISYGVVSEMPDGSLTCNALLELAERRLHDSRPESPADKSSSATDQAAS